MFAFSFTTWNRVRLHQLDIGTDGQNALQPVGQLLLQAQQDTHFVGIQFLTQLDLDFEGIEGNLEISSPDRFYLLSDELERQGMPMSIIEKLFYRNAQRVLSL